MDEEEVSYVSALVQEVFLDFIAPQYTHEGKQTFLSYIEPDALLARLEKGEALGPKFSNSREIKPQQPDPLALADRGIRDL
jgi:hypothetical protein